VDSASDLKSSTTTRKGLSNDTSKAGKVYQGALQPKSFPGLPENWTSEWETFPSSDGALQLFAVTHHPVAWAKEPQGFKALIVIHGLGEHGGRYLHLPHFLKSAVDCVFCLDLRGHGRSEGLRGHVERFDLHAEDVALAIYRLEDHLTKRFGKAEIHLFGHSMGGLIALRTLFLQPNLPIKSATVSAPLLGVKVPVPAIKKAAGQVLSRLWGSIHMRNELDPRLVSHDAEVVQAYQQDRLVHDKVTPRFYTELQSAIADTMARDSGMNYPLQIVVPLQDAIVDPEASLAFFRALKHRDKQLKTYPGFFHEPVNELGKEQVFEDIRTWITRHTANSSS